MNDSGRIITYFKLNKKERTADVKPPEPTPKPPAPNPKPPASAPDPVPLSAVDAPQKDNNAVSAAKSKDRGCVGCGIFLLIIALIGVGMPFLVPWMNSTFGWSVESFFLKTVDYVDEKIGLSDYSSAAMDDNSYKDKDPIHVSWSAKDSGDYPSQTQTLILEGGVSYVNGQTTVGDFLKNGYTLSDSAPSQIAANDSEGFMIYYQGNRLYVSAENDSSSEKPVESCAVSRLSVDNEDGVSFKYGGLNGESSFDDMLSALGKPNGSISISIFCQYNDKSQITLYYHYSNHVTFEIAFEYLKKTKQATFYELSVY